MVKTKQLIWTEPFLVYVVGTIVYGNCISVVKTCIATYTGLKAMQQYHERVATDFQGYVRIIHHSLTRNTAWSRPRI